LEFRKCQHFQSGHIQSRHFGSQYFGNLILKIGILEVGILEVGILEVGILEVGILEVDVAAKKLQLQNFAAVLPRPLHLLRQALCLERRQRLQRDRAVVDGPGADLMNQFRQEFTDKT
jgi:hypothetical protein